MGAVPPNTACSRFSGTSEITVLLGDVIPISADVALKERRIVATVDESPQAMRRPWRLSPEKFAPNGAEELRRAAVSFPENGCCTMLARLTQ